MFKELNSTDKKIEMGQKTILITGAQGGLGKAFPFCLVEWIGYRRLR
jgi:NADP-dependent 3-hydroxy acid dehydrogenase YdfG